MDLKPVLYVVGILLSVLSLSMSIPMAADLYVGHENWKVFSFCIILTGFFGGILVLTNHCKSFDITLRQGFFLTGLSWIILGLFAALPFWLSGHDISLTDSIFESISGITTTGSTVFVGLDTMPHGILLWRSLLQWLGGIGIIVMALSILPFLKVGGMQLFKMESSENEKAMPRTTQLATSIAAIYLILTIICAICYMSSGLPPFHALCHAMTTIATGGFSTYDSSFANFSTVWTECVAIIFMILGSLPFVLYLKAIRGKVSPLLNDTQVRAFFYIVCLSIIAMVSYLVLNQNLELSEALRRASFNVVSIITGTGYSNGNYALWGGFPVALFFFLMVIGGCAGSTSCGIKIFRFQVLYAVAITQIQQLLHPHGRFVPQYNGKPIPKDVPTSVLSFFFLYALSFTVLAIALSFVGLDFLTAMSGAATSISNVGPGLGDIIGPEGNFHDLPSSAKWILCVGMLLGRLEIFTVLVLFAPRFWKY